MRRLKRGKWVVFKHQGRPLDNPWVVTLWGGNGTHPMDDRAFATWEEAWAHAIIAYWTTVPSIHLTQRTEAWS